jgi:hypothetical protein
LNGGRKVNWARVITTLVVQLAARVGKSRATPICPFLYHLYERKELLRPEEEKAWKIQEGMLKYGKSGSEDEARSASGSDDEEDDKEEEEEETQVLLNRPPKRPRQEDKSEQAGATLVPKLEGPSLSSSKDRFQSICKALGEMQAEHERRGELLMEACQLAVCGPSELPERIRKMMMEQARVEDSIKVEGGEREAQPRGGEPPQREPGCMGTSGSSSSIGGADPGLRAPSRTGGGEGGVI